MIEAKTYRHRGHSRTDPAKYRPAEEVEYWLSRDPVSRLRDKLVEEGMISSPELEALEAEVEAEIEHATQVALDAPEPSVNEAYADVFCEEGSSWRN